MVTDCKDIIGDAVYKSRRALVEGYHALGKRIVTDNNLDRKEVYGKKIAQDLAQSIGISERTLYYAVQFYEKCGTEKVSECHHLSYYPEKVIAICHECHCVLHGVEN
jgi:hypothetical protein